MRSKWNLNCDRLASKCGFSRGWVRGEDGRIGESFLSNTAWENWIWKKVHGKVLSI